MSKDSDQSAILYYIYIINLDFLKCPNSLTPQYINQMFHLRPINDNLQSLRSASSINYVLPRPQKEILKNA